MPWMPCTHNAVLTPFTPLLSCISNKGRCWTARACKIGVVEGIVGLFKWKVRLIGVANHAGTTPMNMRRDAFQGLAELSGEIPRILEEHGGPRSVATIGRVELFPGAANVVPGKAEFSLEVRDTDPVILNRLADAFRRALSAIARRRDLMFEFEVMGELTPVKCDSGMVDTISTLWHDHGCRRHPHAQRCGARHPDDGARLPAPA